MKIDPLPSYKRKCKIEFKQNRDRLIDREQGDSYGGGELGGGGMEQKGKRTRGHGQQCGECGRGKGIRALNGNGKNKVKRRKKERIAIQEMLKRTSPRAGSA